MQHRQVFSRELGKSQSVYSLQHSSSRISQTHVIEMSDDAEGQPVLATMTVAPSPSGKSCEHLRQSVCTMARRRELESKTCSDLVPFDSKRCWLDMYSRTSDERYLGLGFWQAVARDLTSEMGSRKFWKQEPSMPEWVRNQSVHPPQSLHLHEDVA